MIESRNRSSILLVEDDRNIQDFNKELLEEQGYAVALAMDLAEARKIFAARTPDLIVLDVMLPDGSGFDWLVELRETSRVPVLMLTAKGELAYKLQGYDSGADDYLPKPYDYEEFIARVGALLYRTKQVPERIALGVLSIDTVSKRAFLYDTDLMLTAKEFSLLDFFTQNESRLMKAEYIYQKVWGQPMAGNSTAIRTTASRLRNKMKGSGYTISFNVQNDGYCFEKE